MSAGRKLDTSGLGVGVAKDLSLFSRVQPRSDVLSGTLTEAIFAANLDEVALGTAPDTYGDPRTFFETTHPSGGLRSLLNEALGRVGGGRPDGAPVIRLETNLGGGKTHNLIALFHASQGHLDKSKAAEFMDPALLPAASVEQVAIFVGASVGATSFPEVQGIKPHTLWGYLVAQLGGKTAYELVKKDDEDLTAPGADALKKVFADKPNLILLDELARYLVTAKGVTVGKSTLDEQTTAFLMALMEAVDASARAALVVTTTEVTDAFGDETQQVLDTIAEARSLLSRKEHILRPSDEADLPKILRRRLFSAVDDAAANSVASEYSKAASDAFSRGADLPERMTGPAWVGEIEASFPFHPNLIQILDKRLSTIPNFHRTRGALRLLARAVRVLWNAKPNEVMLLHPHHIDLGDNEIKEELSSRIDRPKFEPVIRADVASEHGGGASHAEMVDQEMGSSYARRLAASIYLYSLTADVPGVPESTILGSVLAPGDDPNVVGRALEKLEATAWYLHSDSRGYRFSTEASLVRLIDEAERQITPSKAKAEATDILARVFKDSALKVKRTWEDSKVPDKADDAWLVILHWDDFGASHGVEDPTGAAPPKVQELWEKTPTGGLREFRNRLVFLLPTSSSHENMVRAVRRHLALRSLEESPDALTHLSDDKRKELRERSKQSELEARVAVCNHVNALHVPRSAGLEGIELDVVTQASLRQNQTEAVLERLAAMEKTLAAGDKPLDPGLIKSRLGAMLDSAISTSQLVQAFARRGDLKLVLDRAQIVALVGAGIKNGVWEYQDPERGDDGWGTKDHSSVAVRLAEDTYLHPVGKAPAPKPLACPFCGQVHAPGPCPDDKGGQPKPVPPQDSFTAEGAAGVAVQAVREKAVEAGGQTVRSLTIALEAIGDGTGVQLTRLHSIVPTGVAGVEIEYQCNVALAFDQMEHTLQFSFRGQPADFQPLKSGLDHTLKARQASLRASLVATFADPMSLSGESFEEIRRRAAEHGPDKCTVTISTGSIL